MHISVLQCGRKQPLTTDWQEMICKSTMYFASNLTPLSPNAFVEVVETIKEERREDVIEFCMRRWWLNGFLKLHEDVIVQSVQSIDACWTDALRSEPICENSVRFRSSMELYNMKSPQYAIKINQSEFTFKAMTGRKR